MPTEYQAQLLERILIASSTQAEQLLEMHDTSSIALERTTADLEMSPLLDKQFLGTALRLAKELCLSGGIRSSLLKRFRSAVPGVAIEAQRRAIEREVKDKGLPMELASDYVDTLQRRIVAPEHELPNALWGYAALYDDLWCDPRIGARTPTRRIMLAMVTVLRARSAELNARLTQRATMIGRLQDPQFSPTSQEPVLIDMSSLGGEAILPRPVLSDPISGRNGNNT